MGPSGPAPAAPRHDARRRAPAIVFLDEVDALGARGAADGCAESRLLATLLCEMDGARAPSAERVVVIGATNRPDALDASLRRAGRFDREMEVGVPSEDQRRSIAIALLAHTPHALSGARLDELAACTAGFVGADLAALHRHAALAALAGAHASLLDEVDALLSAVPTPEPILDIRATEAIDYLAIVGGDSRTRQVENAVLEKRPVLVDLWEQVSVSGEFRWAQDMGTAGQIALARGEDGRVLTVGDAAQGDVQIARGCVYLTGIAAQDLCAAAVVYKRWLERDAT